MCTATPPKKQRKSSSFSMVGCEKKTEQKKEGVLKPSEGLCVFLFLRRCAAGRRSRTSAWAGTQLRAGGDQGARPTSTGWTEAERSVAVGREQDEGDGVMMMMIDGVTIVAGSSQARKT